MVEMIQGWPFTVRALKKSDSKALRRFISDRLSRTDSDSTLPTYLRRLFANISHNVQAVELNMFVLNYLAERVRLQAVQAALLCRLRLE